MKRLNKGDRSLLDSCQGFNIPLDFGFSDGIKKFIGDRKFKSFNLEGMYFQDGTFETFPGKIEFFPLVSLNKRTMKKLGLETGFIWSLEFKSEIDSQVEKLVKQYRLEGQEFNC